MRFDKKRVLVLGAGKSGMGAKEFLEVRGAFVVVHDDNDKKVQEVAEFNVGDFDLCVISPGVGINHPIATQMRDHGVPILGELELGFTARHKKIIAVTGTNGKTTVVNMINDALTRNTNFFARKSVLCGNVGVPVTSVSREIRRKTAVAEVSSFQMESAQNFRPKIAVILNITQDHLERHGTMEEYTRCKSQIYANQTKRDILILNYDDENCRKLAGGCAEIPAPRGKVLWFSTTAKVKGIYLDGKDVILNLRRRAIKLFTLDQFGEEKPHGIQNILAALLVSCLMCASKGAMLDACKSARGPHRMQYVASIETEHGTAMMYNDSKATNVAATLAACNCFKSPVNLLVGGMAKGQDFTELFANLPPVVENVFAFGECADQIIAASQTQKPAHKCKIVKSKDLRDATTRALRTGTFPRVVLLSPACSSFDAFKSYEHRGNTFIQIVNELSVMG